MSSELSWRHSATGKTVYATIRSAVRTYWNGAALEALTVANWADYDVALAETPASSYFYVGTWPVGLTTAGWYWVDLYEQAAGSPAIGDTLIGGLIVYWDGSAANPWSSAVPELTGDPPTLTGLATTPLEMLVALWRERYKGSKLNRSTGLIEYYADDGSTPIATVAFTETAIQETRAAAT
jgi:hypothetical protein